MATLKKRGKSYTIYVQETIGYKLVNGKKQNIKRHIATFNLGKVSKETAITHRNKVNQVEPLIRSGELNESNWDNQFSFLNDEGKFNIIEVRKLGETIQEFLDFKEESIRKSSFDRVRVSMDRLLEVIPAKTELKTIKTKHITQYKKYFKGKHRPAGMNVNLTNIRTFFRWCYREEYMDRIPYIVIHKPAKENKHLTEQQIIDVLNACPPLYRKVFKVYLETSKRRSELIEGHLRGNLLIIPVHDDLKSKTSHSVKLNAEQLATIKELHKDRDKYLAKGYLIRSYKDRFSEQMTKILKKLGYYEKWNTKLHSLRHSAGIIEYLESNDVQSVKQKLNHSSLEMSNYYSEIDTNLLEDDFPSSLEVQKAVKKVKGNTSREQLGFLD